MKLLLIWKILLSCSECKFTTESKHGLKIHILGIKYSREKIKRISFRFLTVIVSDQLDSIVKSFRFDFELHGF